MELQLRRQQTQKSQPLIYKGVLYITRPIRRPWRSTRRPDSRSGSRRSNIRPRLPGSSAAASSTAVWRSTDGKIFRTTLDANVIALDQKTGKELWRSNVIDWKDGYSLTVAPHVADGVVITGISGAEYGIRGFIDGWDPGTGKHLWRTYTIAGPGDPEAKSWPGDTWQHGGGSDLDHGVIRSCNCTLASGVPATPDPGIEPNILATTSTVARFGPYPKTGKMKWHFQFSPQMILHDYDSVAEMVLADLNVGGKPTKALMDVNRNGFMYVLDRTDGKLIAANQYITKQTWAKGIDESGRPIPTPRLPTRFDKAKKSMCGQVPWAAKTGARSRSIQKLA